MYIFEKQSELMHLLSSNFRLYLLSYQIPLGDLQEMSCHIPLMGKDKIERSLNDR